MRIIVGRNGKETVKSLASLSGSTVEAHMFFRKSQPWRTNFEKRQRGYVPPKTDETTIYWAHTGGVVSTGKSINARGIANASEKYSARKTMEAAGVRVPKTARTYREAFNGGKVIARPMKHRAGQDFYVLDSDTNSFDLWFLEEGPTEHYFSEFIQKKKEFRVHCAYGKVLALQEKVPNSDDVDLDEARPWNHATGDFVFKTVPWSDYSVDVCVQALKAVQCLMLDMGAVDVIVDADGLAYVCEVNTSPSLCDYTQSRYAKFFTWFDESTDPRKWKFEEYTVGKSFAWKNEQLDARI